ncbi:hypothetical protein RFI_27707 [Reticulomyxa filosa]|uniref:Fe2OG dioxygenase domain-containing protein n=1 Tax=Reticulomyxa filosa TaxID=46433 RepID=X6M7P0_RETFI|nr:hypothetical protein RFI_27707 [Reticulomyxa filosa]|eukprot:ETO09671.1 hypothetical protein RFI_27707 [Reticulomyxa filosa]
MKFLLSVLYLTASFALHNAKQMKAYNYSSFYNNNFDWSQMRIFSNYIHIKNINSQNFLHQITSNAAKCTDRTHSEHRSFGASGYKNSSGHDVTFLNDCVDDRVHNYFHYLLGNAFSTFQSKRGLSTSASKKKYIKWDKLAQFILNNPMATRVEILPTDKVTNFDQEIKDWQRDNTIELLSYEKRGHIGWHIDSDSNVTIAILVNNPREFIGGELEFRTSEKDSVVERAKFEEGDVLIWNANTAHQVLPVIRGTRKVLVVEFWNLGRSWQVGRVGPQDHILQTS